MAVGSTTIFLALIFEHEGEGDQPDVVEDLSKLTLDVLRKAVWVSPDIVMSFNGMAPDHLVAYPHEAILAGRPHTGEPFDF